MKYVVLGTINPKWAEDPEGRVAAVHDKLDRLGIGVESMYYTQGEVDFMEVLEVPSPDAMLALSPWYLAQGQGHLRSMPAFEMDAVMAALAKVRGP